MLIRRSLSTLRDTESPSVLFFPIAGRVKRSHFRIFRQVERKTRKVSAKLTSVANKPIAMPTSQDLVGWNMSGLIRAASTKPVAQSYRRRSIARSNGIRRAEICYVFLSDVVGNDKSDFAKSAWFTRGWTLQELLAPHIVEFYDAGWELIGTKGVLASAVSEATGIPEGALWHHWDFPLAERMSWAATRQTRREEDAAYCLLGIFGVDMPLIYGEGKQAFQRLQQEILKVCFYLTLFAWSLDRYYWTLFELLATSPSAFMKWHKALRWVDLENTIHLQLPTKQMIADVESIIISVIGIIANLCLVPYCRDTYLVPLGWEVDPSRGPWRRGTFQESHGHADTSSSAHFL